MKFQVTISDKMAKDFNEDRPGVEVSLNARKSLDGKIMVFDHKHIDIIVDTAKKKIVTFPKKELTDEVYQTQSNFFDFLAKKGIIDKSSIKGGSAFASLESDYLKAYDEIDEDKIVLLAIYKFIEEEKPRFETEEFVEKQFIDSLTDPSEEESTSFEDAVATHKDKKGSIPTDSAPLRRWLYGHGIYE